MSVNRGEPPQTSDHVDLAKAVQKAKRRKLSDSLARIYGEFPRTACENCARCCFESPGVFFVEHLYLVAHLSGLPRERRDLLLRRMLHELLFSWIDPERTCIFLESSHCTLYDRRPLACRLFGLVSPTDRDQAEVEARMAAREEAGRLSLLGIRVPEEIVGRSLVSCDRVRDQRGRTIRVDGDAMAARLARLDEALLPREIVVAEFCFRSLPERLGAVLLGDEVVETLRVQLLRRAQSGEPLSRLLDSVWEMVRLPRILAKKGEAR